MNKNLEINYELRKASEHKTSNWTGGVTTELYIYPKDRLYADKDFDWRISSAVVQLEESIFTKLPGYMRHIMVLSGSMELVHEGHHTIMLEPFDQDFFDGSWHTKSAGQCIDFNLMLRAGRTGNLAPVKMNVPRILEKDSMTAYYCMEDHITLEVVCNHENILREKLSKGDFILFHELLSVDQRYEVTFYGDCLDPCASFLHKDTIVAIETQIKYNF